MNCKYQKHGYLVLRDFFSERELQAVKAVVCEFHASWRQKHVKSYQAGAINSAYLTGTEFLSREKRDVLFQFIGSRKIMEVLEDVLARQAAFMNTQLFFDPAKREQKNYWHRDTQYHLSLDEQKSALAGPEVIHFRIPLSDEPGIELIPGSHRRWDSDEELEVRLETHGRKNYDDLPDAARIELNCGDLLVFSANIIHRGIYGLDRLALDILFCDAVAHLLQFSNVDCLPDASSIAQIEDPSAFLTAISLKELQ